MNQVIQKQTAQNNLIDAETMAKFLDDQATRREIAKTLLGFMIIYLPHYLTLPPADFHREMISLLENWQIKFLEIIGFRGSAKSSIAVLALPLWAALEEKAKFIVPINETDEIVKLTIANIRRELDGNDLLQFDYGEKIGKIKAGSTKFAETNIVLANGVRIMGRSRGQKFRGLRHREFRPDLVIIDDPEELEKVQKKEYRDKTERWLRSDIIPAIEETNARLIVIGNILHTDALIARLKNDPIFEHREYPLVDSTGKVTWKAKYPKLEILKRQEQKVGRTAWLREYLLKVVPPEGQEVKEEWIQYYDKIPSAIMASGVGVDLAISKKESADFTAMVSGKTAIENGIPKIYILPNPINARLTFHETIQQMKSLSQTMEFPMFFIEDVAYQKAAIQEAQRQGLPTIAMKTGTDKRARLRAAATFIQNGTVLFPRKGCEDLLTQLLGFGVEDHDDLVDALVYLIFGLNQHGLGKPEVVGLL
jgi:predicted phage terminase large subunit-like protein